MNRTDLSPYVIGWDRPTCHQIGLPYILVHQHLQTLWSIALTNSIEYRFSEEFYVGARSKDTSNGGTVGGREAIVSV